MDTLICVVPVSLLFNQLMLLPIIAELYDAKRVSEILKCYDPIWRFMPEDKSFIYKTEAQLRFCQWNFGLRSQNVIWAITFYHMTSNGVFYDFGCIMETYLYKTYQEQPIFQQKNNIKIYENVTL